MTMATQHSKSKFRQRKNRTAAKERFATRPPEPTDFPFSNPYLAAIEESIEAERARLMTAHTLLSCAAIAMDAEDIAYPGPYYPTIVELARDLVNESISKLDAANLELAMAAQKPGEDEEEAEEELDVYPRGKYEVREPEFKYLS
jgi:hypothetical protein